MGIGRCVGETSVYTMFKSDPVQKPSALANLAKGTDTLQAWTLRKGTTYQDTSVMAIAK